MNIDPERNIFKSDLGTEELAAIVRDEIQQAQSASASALAHGIAAGEALLAAQRKVVKGDWEKWLRDNCSIAESTARLYMQLAKRRDEIEAEIQRGVDLSIRAARRLIATPPEDKETKQRRQRKEPETLIAHWERCPEERKELLDQVTVAGIKTAMSEKFAQQLRVAATPANPFTKLRDMDAAAIASAIFEAVDRAACKEIVRKLQAKLEPKTVHLQQDQYRRGTRARRASGTEVGGDGVLVASEGTVGIHRKQ